MKDEDIKIEDSKKKKKIEVKKIGVNEEKAIKETRSTVDSIKLALIALALASAAYFISKFLLFPDVVIWAREILSLILALLIAAGFGSVFKGEDNRIGGSVVTFLFAIFIWQIVSAYSDYDFSRDEERVSRTSSTEVRVRTLYPREKPYVFHLAEVGDETEYFKAPTGIKYSIFYSSHNLGYELIYNDGTVYRGDPNNPVPKKRHAVIKIRATKPNQFVNVRLVER
jgi:hypothetical protein